MPENRTQEGESLYKLCTFELNYSTQPTCDPNQHGCTLVFTTRGLGGTPGLGDLPCQKPPGGGGPRRADAGRADDAD